ncbi:MAG: DEAD/DEAH box helicase family protein [Candidatus Aminicenantia bacterium]
MLCEDFNANLKNFGPDFHKNRLEDEVITSLNPKFLLREYQKETIGRFIYYMNGYYSKRMPVQLLFHMATGSGKTLIMAANILYLYKLGYSNFIFFVNSTNIIEKTKDNFLNSLSEKYLFAPKIKFGEKQVDIKEVQNFEAANPENINIIFTTIQGLHTRLNYPKENALTYEDFADKEIVLISDEAHHLQTLTKSKLSGSELEEKTSWEFTVERIFRSSLRNILLEFTATIDLSNQDIRQKYEDKIIFQYDLKQFRLDKYSKEIEVLQADLDPNDRALQAVVLSQYRRKISEKHKIRLKPVVLFKSKTIKESKENYEGFLTKIKKLSSKDIQEIYSRAKGTKLENAFNYFQKENITFDNLIRELQEDFSEEKCMLLDSENIDEEKQLKLNSLENKNNEVRAIFAVNMLNEGWDVLNLFDIVRLYDTRDGKWVRGKYKPGNTTMGEAQLIGRGARYFPFQIDEIQDKYKRRFDDDAENELHVIETLHYHSLRNPKYIKEIKTALTEIGILPEKYIQKDLFVKDSFKKTEFWKEGVVFINDRIQNPRTEIFSLQDARIEEKYRYELRTGEIKEEIILDEEKKPKASKDIARGKMVHKLDDFGENIVRNALDRLEFYKFKTLRKYFAHIKSVREFISSLNYLGSVSIEVLGPKDKMNKLTSTQKLEIALFVIKKISEQAKINTSEFIGTKLFKAQLLRDIFGKNEGRKTLKLDSDSERAKELVEMDLKNKDWYAQNEIYGTDEEKNFIKFINEVIEKLRQKHSDIALLRNEKFFQVFDFDEGRAFEPDFIMILKKRNRTISIYQIFIEPKGDQFKDSQGRFESSKEGWKQKFLLEMEEKADTDLRLQNKHFKLMGLPFYNEKLKKDFEEALENKILS